ncbi:Ubiquitin-conjugating enzyme E2 S-B [Neolecta irregularis DAH-3]|uniref:E2 ubiquitin-conjugating enzyme n=1 Tax=Neolecta irregularis (strain DAH-3) TaxID=1198029 RepID=A0A1U7LIR6_NEOID|nr:Ubiquitin-conjugating enzyme E2 S-B [Neolecta irregularis DAH-3]|eukprot:OLL22545.1 Ubiquitin-conjugating enzyme E2 S-B [Neolecta irregularis DAH-3]
MTSMFSGTVMRRIVKEKESLRRDPPQDIRIVELGDSDITDLQALIMGPEKTPFEGGAFKCKVIYGSDYPSGPPTCTFITRIFHPNISTSGQVCLNTLKKDWNSEMTISHVLLTVKCLLINPFPESALNEDAGKLLLDGFSLFARQAKLMTSIHAIKSLQVDEILGYSMNPGSAVEDVQVQQTECVKKKDDIRRRGLKRL